MRLLVSAGCLLCWLPSSFQASEARSLSLAAGSKPGFIEYYLGHINPQGIDYGQRIQAARRRWVENTIGDLGFWTALAMFLLSLLGFVIVLHQHREKNRREIIAASLLAEYHNAWMEAGRRAEEAIARYNDLARTREREKPPWRSASAMANSADASEHVAEGNLTQPQRHAGQRDAAAELRGRERLALSQPDLLNQVSALQQQLSAASEREKNLERVLSRTARKLPRNAAAAENASESAQRTEKK